MQNPLRYLLSRLRFADAEQERRYHAARAEWLAPRLLPLAIVAAGIFLAFIPLDRVVAPPYASALAVARISTAVVLVAIGLLTRPPVRLPMTFAACLIAAIIYAGVFWTRLIVGPDIEYRFTSAVTLIQVGVWFLGGMTFLVAAAVNIVGLIAFLLIELTVGVPTQLVVVSSLYLIALNGLSALASWNIELLVRRNFVDNEELAIQREEYRGRAMRDGLTGLWNRQAMEEQLVAACRRSAATKLSGAVLIVDLDRFKPINDRFGHQAGNDVLVSIARRIVSVVRPGDTVGRIGGDEFMVLAENIPNAGSAGELAERIRREVESPIRARLYGDSGNTQVTVGASIGISLFSGTASAIEEIIIGADREMYRSKAQRKGHSTDLC